MIDHRWKLRHQQNVFQLVKFIVLQFQFNFWQKSLERGYNFRAQEPMISKFYMLMETI